MLSSQRSLGTFDINNVRLTKLSLSLSFKFTEKCFITIIPNNRKRKEQPTWTHK
ncbi:hypothetical protein X975_12515, partial [Stegodyphus mimosarum]